MNSKLTGLALALALGLGATLGQSAPALAAAGEAPQPRIERHTDGVQLAQNYDRHRRYDRNQHYDRQRHGPRYRYSRPGFTFFFNGFWYSQPWWQPGHQYRPAPSHRSAHVRWCEQRYRSYNPARDAYRGYDGRWHRCISPYRR